MVPHGCSSTFLLLPFLNCSHHLNPEEGEGRCASKMQSDTSLLTKQKPPPIVQAVEINMKVSKSVQPGSQMGLVGLPVL